MLCADRQDSDLHASLGIARTFRVQLILTTLSFGSQEIVTNLYVLLVPITDSINREIDQEIDFSALRESEAGIRSQRDPLNVYQYVLPCAIMNM